MAKNKREVIDIDEAALLQSVYEQGNSPVVQPITQKKVVEPAPEQAEKPQEVKEAKETKEPVRRKRSNADYSNLFLQRNEFKARSCVYISQNVHFIISKIVKVVDSKNVTVGGYIDNVLLQHLEAHKDEINDLYKKERNDLIEF